MRVYRKIVIDGKGNTVDAVSEEYFGTVAECGGGGGKGGGSSSTNISSTPDYAYNARMAAVAERQQNLSDQFYNWWQQVQAPVEQATAQAQLGLIPAQTDIAKEGLEGFKGIQSSFYDASRPTSAEAYAGRAVTDANAALGNAQAQAVRNQQRMGVNPNSGAAQALQQANAISGAATLAGAANTGRTAGEQANLQKLGTAMQFGLQG